MLILLGTSSPHLQARVIQAHAAPTKKTWACAPPLSLSSPHATMSTAPAPTATRLIFTNLPPSLTVAHLRTHLARCPPFPPSLTDLKVLLKPDGTSRRLAFAGFKDPKEAARVLEWVKGTWVQGAVGGARIEADWAREVRSSSRCRSRAGANKLTCLETQAKDAPPPRKRAKLSPPPQAPVVDATPTLAAAPAPVPSGKGAQDEAARFAEFMSVMGPRKGRALEEQSEPAMLLPTPVAPVVTPVVEPVKEKKEKKVEPVKEVEVVRDKIIDDEEISDMEYMTRRMKRKLEVDEEPEVEQDDEVGPAKEWVQDEDGVPAQVSICFS